jgi:hypothetical protein
MVTILMNIRLNCTFLLDIVMNTQVKQCSGTAAFFFDAAPLNKNDAAPAATNPLFFGLCSAQPKLKDWGYF